MMAATKLFNIRITPDQHAKFKKYAAERNVTMGAILNNYINSLLRGDTQMIGMKGDQKRNTNEDPLDALRGQYRPGEDF
jgi:hypothetical protein